MRRVHEAQHDVIASLSEEDLKLTVENGMRLDEYLTSTIRHDIWHAAQIAVGTPSERAN